MFKNDRNFKKFMAGIDNLNIRLNYQGGKEEDRSVKDKIRSLKGALLHSDQSEVIRLIDGREFRCLINKDKLSEDYYDQIISIPYKDICLNKPRVGKTTIGEELIDLKPGEVFTWVGYEKDGVKRPDTDWIVYLRHLNEKAYFMADIRQCNAEVSLNGNTYRAYVRGPAETTIPWNQKAGIIWNDINYSLVMYITRTDEALDYFHRFTKVKIDGNMWEVATVNPYYANGIIKVCLNETFNNEMEEIREEETNPIPPQSADFRILGPLEVFPYDKVTYSVEGISGGEWKVSNSKKAKVRQYTELTAMIEIITGKSGEFNLIYHKDGKDLIVQPIVIKSF